MKKYKVIGIGWAKTGTTSLGKAMEILGYKHKTQDFKLLDDLMVGNYKNIKENFFDNNSFDDWPWIILYKQLDIICEDCKFILTIRDEQKWLKSYKNMLRNEGAPTQYANKIRTFLYKLDFPNISDDELLDVYRQHIKEVKNFFRYRNEDLLIIDWEEGSSWEKLCKFLSESKPNVEFPHYNKGSYN